MKIYRLRLNVKDYQWLFPEDESIWQSSMLIFDCSPKIETWVPPKVYVLHPKLRRGNFLNLCPGAFVIDDHAAETLRDFLEMSGELLPLPLGDERLFVFNALECTNSLNSDESQWELDKHTGARVRLREHAFYATRLTETPLFKIPETCRSEILTVDGLIHPEGEFKHCVAANSLEGLRFEEVWQLV